MSDPNSAEVWNELWSKEGLETWRTYPNVYNRVVRWVPPNSKVVEFGCGVGVLAKRLSEERSCKVYGFEHSPVAVGLFRQNVPNSFCFKVDIEDVAKQWGSAFLQHDETVFRHFATADVVIATEVLEHLSDEAMHWLLGHCFVERQLGFFSVPNFCLGPDEEPQHARKFTALEFKKLLESYWGKGRVRIECWDHYLLGICGYEKKFKLSVTFPARDEAADVERTLKSFMAIADELVIGVDYRSKDATEEVARRYADTVFTISDPLGPLGEEVENPNGVHFSHIRNRCIERCTGDWIFMTEAHESLQPESIDYCLFLDAVPEHVGSLSVVRESPTTQWAFPWVFRNNPRIRFKNATHNILDHPDTIASADWPQVKTYHFRDHTNALLRETQRSGQNRQELLKKILKDSKDSRSRFYLANEYRAFQCWGRAIHQYQKYLEMSQNKAERYQARLSLSRCFAHQGKLREAREVLLSGAGEDWSRNEHYIYLGDLARVANYLEEALQWYRVACAWTETPLSPMFIDKAYYSYLPWQKRSEVASELGRAEEALECVDKIIALREGSEDCTEAELKELQENRQLCLDMRTQIGARKNVEYSLPGFGVDAVGILEHMRPA